MAKKISITAILIVVGFFCFGSNVLLAKEYTSIEDIKLDGEDAIGQKTNLCIQKGFIDNDSAGTYFVADQRAYLMRVYFEKNQKELVKNIKNMGPTIRDCTRITIKIIGMGGLPKGKLLSVE